jgi:hypothetical protein
MNCKAKQMMEIFVVLTKFKSMKKYPYPVQEREERK